MSFELRPDGYDMRDHQGGADAAERPQMADAGWNYRSEMARQKKFQKNQPMKSAESPTHPAAVVPRRSSMPAPRNAAVSRKKPTRTGDSAAGGRADRRSLWTAFADRRRRAVAAEFDMAKQQHTGIVLGIAMACCACSRTDQPNGGCEDRFLTLARRRRQAHLPHRRHAAQGRRATISPSSISTKAR